MYRKQPTRVDRVVFARLLKRMLCLSSSPHVKKHLPLFVPRMRMAFADVDLSGSKDAKIECIVPCSLHCQLFLEGSEKRYKLRRQMILSNHFLRTVIAARSTTEASEASGSGYDDICWVHNRHKPRCQALGAWVSATLARVLPWI